MEKKRRPLSLVSRIFTVSLVLIALPLTIFIFAIYRADMKSAETIAHLRTQIDLSSAIAQIEEVIDHRHQRLSDIFANIEGEAPALHSKSGRELYLFKRQGAFWSQVASSTNEPMESLPHTLLDRIARGYGTTNLVGSRIVLGAGSQKLILLETEPEEIFLKEALRKQKSDLHFSLRPLLQMPRDQIVYKKSIPGTSLYMTATLSKASYRADIHAAYFNRLISISALGFAALALISIIIQKRMAYPYKRFLKAMDQLADGDFSVRLPEDGKGLELHDLSHTFNSTLDTLQHTMQSEQKNRLEKERLSAELAWARAIQKELLPPSIEGTRGLDIAADSSPALEVSGDFYDLFENDGKLLLVIADSSGKGLGPALFSLGFRGALRAGLTGTGESFAERTLRANKLFCLDSKESGIFTTAFMAEVDLTTYEMTYINAGHNPPLFVSKQKRCRLEKTAPAFGIEWQRPTAQSIQLEPGSLLLTYTDGLFEQLSERGEPIGIESIEVKANTSVSAGELTNLLLEEFKMKKGANLQADDLTLLVVRRPD
jgi:HAMP domain-containing protein